MNKAQERARRVSYSISHGSVQVRFSDVLGKRAPKVYTFDQKKHWGKLKRVTEAVIQCLWDGKGRIIPTRVGWIYTELTW